MTSTSMDRELERELEQDLDPGLGTVLVTGGASGLGAAVAAGVAGNGGTPVVLDVRPTESGHDSVVVDLRDGRATERAVDEAARRHGGLRAVVTCAGIDACGRIEDIDPDAWEDVIRVNLLGTAAVVRAALPHLVDSGGRVVTVASTLGLRALSDATAYCASKFGVVGFTRALAVEMQGRVGVTMLVPGGMDTAFFDGRAPENRPGADARLNRPADVAGAVIFALQQPPGCEVRELVVTPSVEPSWP
jgi:NAD(P)-dependent dehydrogenase (short-subunit alcohol dehydrogenase family)